MQPRIPLPSDDQLPADIRETLANLPGQCVPHDGECTGELSWIPSTRRLDLDAERIRQSEARDRNLRVARSDRSSYEWTQHVRLALQIGVTQEEIDRIGVDGPVQGLDDEGLLLCRSPRRSAATSA
jgi:hypothetical protein